MNNQFIRYRKVNIFGRENSGKKSFIKFLIKENEDNDSYLNYFDDDNNNSQNKDNLETITKIKGTYKDYFMFLNICSKTFPKNGISNEDIKNLIYETELIILIIDITTITDLKYERNLLNNLLEIESDKIYIIFNKTDLDYEENKYLIKFKEDYSQFTQFPISLRTEENIDELIESIYYTLYNSRIININNLISFQEINISSSPTKINLCLKIVILGNSSVGKSSFIKGFFSNKFLRNSNQKINDIEKQLVKISNKIFELSVWDTAGNEKINPLIPQNYNNTNAFVILFDVNKKQTFENIKNLIEEIRENKENIIIYIIGNKIDLDKREIKRIECINFANKYNIKYVEVSCKTGLNIYESMANIILDSSEISSDTSKTFQISIQKHKKKKNIKEDNKCC